MYIYICFFSSYFGWLVGGVMKVGVFSRYNTALYCSKKGDTGVTQQTQTGVDY